MIRTLPEIARDMAVAVDTTQWDSEPVQHYVEMRLRMQLASQEELDTALGIVVDRVSRHAAEDVDATALIVFAGGMLIENGATAQPLAELLLEKLPGVLDAACRFADACLNDSRTPHSLVDLDKLAKVATIHFRPIFFEVFLDQQNADPVGGIAFSNVEKWVSCAKASWTRCREILTRATQDEDLCLLADRIRPVSRLRSLHTLLSVQLDALWLVLFPLEQRRFRVRIDGVAGNYCLAVLLAAELVPLGVPGRLNPREVIDYLKDPDAEPVDIWGRSSWFLFDYRAASSDFAAPVPSEFQHRPVQVLGDIPKFHGQRVLLIGPSSYQQSWITCRILDALPCSVTVEEELTFEAYQGELERLKRG